MIASVSTESKEDATAISLRAVAVLLRWCRMLRVLLVSPTLGPYVLILLKTLFGEACDFLVLLCFLLAPVAAS